MGLGRVIDDLGAEPGEQLVHLHRVLGIVDVAHRPHPLAAIVGGHAQAGERPDDLVADSRLADVAVDHVEQVADFDAAGRIREPPRRQARVDAAAHLRVVGHQRVGLL